MKNARSVIQGNKLSSPSHVKVKKFYGNTGKNSNNY